MNALYGTHVSPILGGRMSNLKTAEAIGQKGAVMQYKNFEQTVVLSHGLDLVGWTHKTFANPGSLPASIEPLRELLNALETGACRFIRLSHAERQRRKRTFEEGVEAGTASAKVRKTRDDIGRKRGPYRRRGNSGEQGEAEPARKRRCTEANPSDADLSGEGSERE